MSEPTPENPDTETTTAEVPHPGPAPVRVPNVSAGAVSGLDHQVIGSNAADAHAENQAMYDAQNAADPDEKADNPSDDSAGEGGTDEKAAEAGEDAAGDADAGPVEDSPADNPANAQSDEKPKGRRGRRS